jgi:hypothetical protein
VNVCANCRQAITWLNTLGTWIHMNTGRRSCDIPRAGLFANITGRREAQARPSRRHKSLH